MKTTIEVHGYEIKIDEMNDKIMVTAVRDGETVEEFELDVEAGFEDDDEGGMEPFDGEEEDDFDMDDMGDEDDDDDEEEFGDDMPESDDESDDEIMDDNKKLESFAHFVRRKR